MKVYLDKLVVKVAASKDWLWMGDDRKLADAQAAGARKSLGIPIAIESWRYEHTKTGSRVVGKMRLSVVD